MPESSAGRLFASPLARRLATDAGLSLDALTGTGPAGRIVRHDVELAVGRRSPAPPTGPPASGSQTIPHFYLRGSARVDRLLALRAELNAESPVKISVNDLVVKAVAQAHQLVPAVNVIWTDDSLLTRPDVDLSVAIATDTGLFTPVLRDVGRMSISAVAAATRDLTARARAGRLHQSELEGGTSTITNLGRYGTEDFTAIVNPPQSTVLAVGAARPEPVVGAEGALEVATVLRVTLSVDHRPVDGATAAEWMRAFIGILEHPLRIVA